MHPSSTWGYAACVAGDHPMGKFTAAPSARTTVAIRHIAISSTATVPVLRGRLHRDPTRTTTASSAMRTSGANALGLITVRVKSSVFYNFMPILTPLHTLFIPPPSYSLLGGAFLGGVFSGGVFLGGVFLGGGSSFEFHLPEFDFEKRRPQNAHISRGSFSALINVGKISSFVMCGRGP